MRCSRFRSSRHATRRDSSSSVRAGRGFRTRTHVAAYLEWNLKCLRVAEDRDSRADWSAGGLTPFRQEYDARLVTRRFIAAGLVAAAGFLAVAWAVIEAIDLLTARGLLRLDVQRGSGRTRDRFSPSSWRPRTCRRRRWTGVTMTAPRQDRPPPYPAAEPTGLPPASPES